MNNVLRSYMYRLTGAASGARAWMFQTAWMSSIERLLARIAADAIQSAEDVPTATASGPAIAAPSGLRTLSGESASAGARGAMRLSCMASRPE
jgi:hypothetical protein